MNEPLRTYVSDHLGGAQIALQLLDSMKDRNDSPEFRKFAATLLPEIQADERTLRLIGERTGEASSTTKIAGGWLLEKAARLKLGHTGSVSFELFESLELLALGIQGKLGLWKALKVASAADSRLNEFDFGELLSRAHSQYETVEQARLALAEKVFRPAT